MSAPIPGTALHRLPLHELHLRHQARFGSFAGYQMPVHYAPGVLREHLHTRAAASLFDVSHMGQLALYPRNAADLRSLGLALESLIPVDVVGLKPNRQRYAFLTTESGGIRDDLMIANLGDHFLLVVNAAHKHEQETYLRQHLAAVGEVRALTERVLLALQGPRAADELSEVVPGMSRLQFMDAVQVSIHGERCWITRSGYTGEDGFELSLPGSAAFALAEDLLGRPSVGLAGLGARDSLRLEAGLCLHGADIDGDTSPVQAALEWAIQSIRRAGGARAGGFPGADVILAQLRDGAHERRVGLRSEQRPVRGPAHLFADDESDKAVGRLTSGGFGPSLNAPVAMGYVSAALAVPGTRLFTQLRGQRVEVTVAPLPFVLHRYRR